ELGKQMTELLLLRAEVFDVRRVRRDFYGHAFDDRKAVAFETDDLTRIVRQEADFLHAEIAKDLGADTVVPEILFKAQLEIRFDGVATLVLQRVGLDLVGKADAAALLVHVDEHAFALLIDHAQRVADLIAAVAARRAEDVAGEALRVHAHEHRVIFVNRILDQRDVLEGVRRVAVDNR